MDNDMGRMAVSSISTYPSEWASLPLDIICAILDKLLEPIDHVRFAAVCKGWRYFSKDYNHTTQRWHYKVLPMLMIPTESERVSSRTNHRVVYSVSEAKIYTNIQLPVRDGHRCCSSSNGWLAIVDLYEDYLYVTLMDPFRKSVAPIRLPSLDYMDLNPNQDDCMNPCDHRVTRVPKVILSADPHLNPNKYVVMVFYSVNLRLAFLKGGQGDWIFMEKKIKYIRDAIFYKSQVYTVGSRGKIASYNVRGRINLSNSPTAKLLTPRPVFESCAIKAYLVESTKGDLFHVRRLLEPRDCHNMDLRTESFRVYKVVVDDEDGSIVQQIEVKSIGDEAFFVGDNHSVSVLASKFPRCQPNCIYYTGDFLRSRHPDGRPFDMAIFNLENETITRFYSPIAWHKGRPRAVWIMPQFNGLC